MEFWEDVQGKIKTVAENAKVEAERLSNIAKIKLNLSDLKLKKRKLYENIGKAYHLHLRDLNDDQQDTKENIDALCDKVDQLNAEMDELNTRLNSYKNKTVCIHCGAKIDSEMSFCPRCGKSAE
jgi:predicted  nucleic acid-binding Zn-ribbon protein